MGKGKNLIVNHKDKKEGERLTNKLDGPFILSFKYKLHNGYTFSDMRHSDLDPFQRFLNKVSDMTWTQVDYLFRRPPDKQDDFKGMQVQHYEVCSGFRVHGVVENSRLKVIRIDPKHGFHK